MKILFKKAENKVYKQTRRASCDRKKCWYYQGTLIEGEGPSTVDLPVFNSLERLLLMLQTLFTFFQNQANLMRWSIVQSLPL